MISKELQINCVCMGVLCTEDTQNKWWVLHAFITNRIYLQRYDISDFRCLLHFNLAMKSFRYQMARFDGDVVSYSS